MTEPQQEPNSAPIPARTQAPDQQPAEAAAPSLAADVAWPDLPAQQLPAEPPGHAAQGRQAQGHQAQGQDPAVSAVLDRLAAVPQTPVSGHGEVYAGMHDALLEALNEDVAGHAGVARRIHAAGDGGS